MQGKHLLAALVFSSMTTNVQPGASGDAPLGATAALPILSLGTIANAGGEPVHTFSAAHKTLGECIARSALESVNYATTALKGTGAEPAKMDVTCQHTQPFNDTISVHREELQNYLDELREKAQSTGSYFKDALSFFDKKAIYGLGISAECDPIAAPKSALQLIGAAQALANTPQDQQVSVDFDRVLEVCRITAGRESADVLVSRINSIAGLKKAGKIPVPLPGEVSRTPRYLHASLYGVDRASLWRSAFQSAFR
jgi:hypothetical protein